MVRTVPKYEPMIYKDRAYRRVHKSVAIVTWEKWIAENNTWTLLTHKEAMPLTIEYHRRKDLAMRIQFGLKYKVVEGSGLDSNRAGTCVPYRGEAKKAIDDEYEAPYGRYHRFRPQIEAVLQDKEGNYFTMFKDRLEPIDNRYEH